MELNDLKQGWQNAGGNVKTEEDLAKMTKIAHHPTLKKIRTKLVAETIGLLLFLTVYYDWFDGDKKPITVNVLLVTSLVLYVLNDVIGYLSIARPVQNINLKLSVEKYLYNIKRLSHFSLAISFLYSVCLIVFFSSVIHFTKEKAFILLGFSVVLFQMTFFSQRIWAKWIKSLQAQVNEFNLDENV